jgi:tyrosyl-tRNA synthetase
VEWQRRFSEGQDPSEIIEVPVPILETTDGRIWVTKLLVLLRFAKSNNEARRLIQGGGVTIGPESSREKITDPTAMIAIFDGLIVRSGKKNVAKVRLV